MKAFVIQEPHRAGVFEVAKPIPAAGEVLVKVVAAGFCGTDIHTYKGEHPTKYPIIPGHEFSGVIEELGQGVTQFKVGDPVVADPNVFCESCYYCKQNMQIHCENIQVIGNTRNGAFAEYVTVPERCVFSAVGMDLIEASMAEPLACCINSHNKVTIRVGDKVLITGAGTIGLMQLQIAKRRGASTVVMVDIKQEQLDLAMKLGADFTLVSGPEVAAELRKLAPRGFDVVIDATGVPPVVEMGIQLLANRGSFIAFGVCPTDSSIKVNPFEIFYRDLKIIGSYALEKTMPQSIAMLSDGKMDLKPLIGEIISLDEMPKKFDEFMTGKTKGKVIVKM